MAGYETRNSSLEGFSPWGRPECLGGSARQARGQTKNPSARAIFERYNIAAERDLNDAVAKMESRSVTSQSQTQQSAEPEKTEEGRKFLNCWCREGESIRAILKGIVKIPPIQANCNTDAGLRVVLARCSKTTLGQFPVIWGDFGRRFTRKS